MHDKLQTRVALLLFAIIIFAWGINWTMTKVLVAHVAPLWTAAIRTSVAAAALLGLLVCLGKLVVPKREDLPVARCRRKPTTATSPVTTAQYSWRFDAKGMISRTTS